MGLPVTKQQRTLVDCPNLTNRSVRTAVQITDYSEKRSCHDIAHETVPTTNGGGIRELETNGDV